jgi:hypothetical protein
MGSFDTTPRNTSTAQPLRPPEARDLKTAPPPALPQPLRTQSQTIRAMDDKLGQRRTPTNTPSPLIPVPAFAPLGVNTPPLYRAGLPSGYPKAEAERTFFSENAVQMNSIVVNLPVAPDRYTARQPYNNDALKPGHIAQAAVKANPNIQIIVPTAARFDSSSDPRFVRARSEIAERLGVAPERVFPVRAKLSWFPQDEFVAGAALAKPLDREPIDHSVQRTQFGVNELGRELNLPVAISPLIGRGGDTHFVDRDGEQFAYFSKETVSYVAAAHGLKITSPQTRLLAIGLSMKQAAEAGVPVNNIMVLGHPERGSNRTYGEVMQAMTSAELARLDPAVRSQLDRMRDLPLPEEAYAYHTDVFAFTPDGKHMFVDQRQATDPGLTATLSFFGFKPVALPAGGLFNPEDPELKSLPPADLGKTYHLSSEVPKYGFTGLRYSNMVQGRLADGRQVILMPTEALRPDQLSARDQQVLALLKSHLPQAVIMPIGGRSAIASAREETLTTGELIDKDYGAHCMSNVLPYVIEYAQLSAP